MKLLLDEMLTAVVAEQLRNRGHDVVAVAELRGCSDQEVFEHAQRDDRAIVTSNRDDVLVLDRLSRSRGRDHHGIVIINAHRFPQGTATVGAIVAALEALLTDSPPYPGFIHWLQ